MHFEIFIHPFSNLWVNHIPVKDAITKIYVYQKPIKINHFWKKFWIQRNSLNKFIFVHTHSHYCQKNCAKLEFLGKKRIINFGIYFSLRKNELSYSKLGTNALFLLIWTLNLKKFLHRIQYGMFMGSLTKS